MGQICSNCSSKEEPGKADAFTETSTAPDSHHSQNASSHLGQQRRIGLHAVAPEVAMRPLEGIHPKYPFENIVFQGGGAKGVIYAGVCLGLEELGITPHLKRFAAASAGCAPALFLALGLNGDQIKKETDALNLYEFFDGGMKNIPIGKEITLGRNLLTNLGMHPANKVMQHFGEVLERYTFSLTCTK